MNPPRALVTALYLGLALDSASAQTEPMRTARRIRAEWIAPHIRFLASDLLEGRETGTRGYRLGAEYVAAEFENLGLKPAGESFFQRVPLRRSEVIDATLSVSSGGGTRDLAPGTDFVLQPDANRSQVSLSGPLIFVGYGLTLPAHAHDDYANLDARGKIVVLVPGGPARIPSDELGHATTLRAKELNALSHGAIGVVTVFPADPATIQERVVRQLSGFAWLDPQGGTNGIFFEHNATVRLTASGAEQVFQAAGRSWAEAMQRLRQGPGGFELPAEIRLSASFRQTDTASANVVGMLRGSDPALREEYVVYTAHLDHVGMGRPVNGDSVHHGALDNAGGTATLLAMAQAFTSLASPPRRSLLFVAVTAEEKAILGSDYFVHHPPISRDRIVADVNMDNYLMLAPVKDLAAYGARYSTLDAVVQQALTQLGIALSDDAAPEQTIFTRSDHYPFLRAGIPGVMLFNGKASGDSLGDGSALVRRWLATVHHTPRDRIDQGILWQAGVAYARANFLIGYQIANATMRPRLKGQPFFLERP